MMTHIRFIEPVAPFNAGEIAGFTDDAADALIRAGQAIPVSFEDVDSLPTGTGATVIVSDQFNTTEADAQQYVNGGELGAKYIAPSPFLQALLALHAGGGADVQFPIGTISLVLTPEILADPRGPFIRNQATLVVPRLRRQSLRSSSETTPISRAVDAATAVIAGLGSDDPTAGAEHLINNVNPGHFE